MHRRRQLDDIRWMWPMRRQVMAERWVGPAHFCEFCIEKVSNVIVGIDKDHIGPPRRRHVGTHG